MSDEGFNIWFIVLILILIIIAIDIIAGYSAKHYYDLGLNQTIYEGAYYQIFLK